MEEWVSDKATGQRQSEARQGRKDCRSSGPTNMWAHKCSPRVIRTFGGFMLSSRLALVSVVMLFAAGCGSYSSPSPAPSPVPAPTPAPGGTAISIPVGASTLGNRAFNPPELDVTVGSTVTWTNTDSTAHTSVSDGNGWNSGIIQPRGQFSTTFSTAGTFHYHCAIHPDMVGTVVVQ